ncbi:MAG TPA: hypothetical protein VHM91_13985 [Verrucomicrobiales bacterium]|jgi:hypothetical protein|nr:hypothetical protein [Verrucomicrobiales bacterium]
MQRISIILFQYAGFLLVCGLASVLYSAETRTAGWNGHGISGLIACGSAAVIIAITAVLAGKGKGNAVWAALGLAFILLSYGGFTFFKLVRDIPGNATEMINKRAADKKEDLKREDAERAITYKAGVFGVMALFSLSAFVRLGTAVRNEKTA